MSFQSRCWNGLVEGRRRRRVVGLMATAATVSAIWVAGFAQPAGAQILVVVAQLQGLRAAVTGEGPGTAMSDQVGVVLNDVEGDNVAQACDDLQGLTHLTEAQAGRKSLTGTEASEVLTSVASIETELGCGSG
jgi:hypothetical protein